MSATRGRGSGASRDPSPTDAASRERRHTEVLESIAAHLGVRRVELRHLPPNLLNDAFAEMALDTRTRATAHVALATGAAGSDEEGLRDFFARQDAERHFPWKAAAHRADLQHAACRNAFLEENAFETLRGTFLSKARSRLLAPFDAAVCTHLLCPPGGDSDWGRFFLASMLLTAPAAERLALHNWTLAREMPAARREAYGTQIAALQNPLFPDAGGFSALNDRLLAGVPLEGGGVDDIFAVGGGFLRIVGPNGPTGEAVETTDLERALAGIQRGIATLRRDRGGRAGGRARGRGRGRAAYRGGGDDDLAEDGVFQQGNGEGGTQ